MVPLGTARGGHRDRGGGARVRRERTADSPAGTDRPRAAGVGWRGREMVDAYRTPDERFADLPGYDFEPHYVEQDGLRMHYVDEGRETRCCSCTASRRGRTSTANDPEDRRVPRCIEPDSGGFGRTDKPTERAGARTTRHTRRSALRRELDLRDMTVVMQDWAAQWHPARASTTRPRRAARRAEHGDRRRPPTGGVAALPGVDAPHRDRDRSGPAWSASRWSSRSADDVIAAYDAPFPVPESRVGVAHVPGARRDEPDHPSAADDARHASELRALDRPALVLFGDSDPIFSRRAAEVIAELLPNAELDPPSKAPGHFLQEDRGERSAARIAAWLAGWLDEARGASHASPHPPATAA